MPPFSGVFHSLLYIINNIFDVLDSNGQSDKSGGNACGGELIQRKDDHPDTVLDRLHVYHEQTEPLKSYYSKTGKLKSVPGQEEVADTTKLVFEALGI